MKQGRPVLYELLKSRGGNRPMPDRAPAPSGHDGEHDDDALPDPPSWGGTGRTMRLPVGYIFVALAGVIIVCVAAYIMGYGRGRDTGEEEAKNDLSAMTESDRIALELAEGDPGGGGGGGDGNDGDDGEGGWQANRSFPSNGSTRLPQDDPDRIAGPIRVSDRNEPREPGMNYFRLIETTEEGAIGVAQFSRDNGLEAYVERAKNGNFRVFVLPGHRPEDRQSEPVTALERVIEQVRTKWKAHTNRDELKGYIPILYQG